MTPAKFLADFRGFKRCSYVSLALTVVTLWLGCSPPDQPLGRVFGKVTYKGQPFSEAELVLSDQSAGVHMIVTLDTDGSYEVRSKGQRGLPPGSYQVALRTQKIEAVTGGPQPKVPPRKHPPIPSRYRSLKSSGLALSVTEGDNQFDIDLEP
jgi:hypothetical protein